MMMRRQKVEDAKIDRLRQCTLFAGLNDRQLADIAGLGDEVRLKAGHVLTRQGEGSRQAFVILEGTCEVLIDGKQVATLGGGELVGELGLLETSVRSATVVAETPVHVLAFDPRSFWAFVDHEGPRHQVMRQLASRIRNADAAYGAAPSAETVTST